MKLRLCALTLFCSGMALILTNGAFPNGVNPPRIKETRTTIASYQERSGQRQQVFRARIATGDKSTELLTVRIGGATEQLAIADIKAVALTGTAVDRNGFTVGTLMRRGASKEESVAVQIRSNGSAYRLTGFSRDGRSTFNFELATYGRIEFLTSADADAPGRYTPTETKK
jgi:hypothetical protein